MYLIAIMDWYSRKVLAWRLSNTLNVDLCREALNEAIQNMVFQRFLIRGRKANLQVTPLPIFSKSIKSRFLGTVKTVGWKMFLWKDCGGH